MCTEGTAFLQFSKVRERCEKTGLLACDGADPDELTRFFESSLSWA